MYGKLEKLTDRLSAELHPSKLGEYNYTYHFNIAIHRLCEIRFLKKLFAVDTQIVPYKH